MMMEEDDIGGSSAGPAHQGGPSGAAAAPPPQINSAEFDLEAYIQNYSGHTKLMRLEFVADRSKDLELEAYKIAINEVKKTPNTALYKALCEKVGDRLGPSYAFDQAWADAVDKRAAQQQEKLEVDLQAAKANLYKEKMRICHNEMGDFLYERGQLNEAIKSYSRTRDYTNQPQNVMQLCLSIIRASIEVGNYGLVVNFVGKAESTPEVSSLGKAKLNAVSGLANLESKKYKLAANKFLEVTFDIYNNYSDVIAAQDIAIYGGLCALATFDRQELKKKVIDNAQFRNFLELVPEMRELINDFYSSRYASMLTYLERLKTPLLLDIHLFDHAEALYQRIRNKALVQYFSPYRSVDLNSMAAAFATPVAALEKELARLIMEDLISARIDSHNKRLYARLTDQRSTTFDTAMRVGTQYQRDSKALLLRANLLKNDFVVRPPRREEHK